MPADPKAGGGTPADGRYHGPAACALADWRRRIASLYHMVRSEPDPERGWHMWRDTRRALFRDHPMSPLPPGGSGGVSPILFDHDPRLRFAVEVDAASGPAETVDLGPDGQLTRRPVGRTRGLSAPLGAELTLYWIAGYGGGLFLPFTDATSGEETYGGGRYLIDAIKGADLGLDGEGRLIVDFNFAYHPSCLHDPAYVCPLAPPQNAIPSAVRAGEKL